MAGSHGSESPRIGRIRQKVAQFGEIVIGTKGVGGFKEPEFRGIGRKGFTKRPNLSSSETFDLEQFFGGCNPVVVILETEHPGAKFFDVIISGKGMAIGIDEGQI